MRSSANLKSFLNGRFPFLIYLKTITWILKLLFFFSHTHTHKFHFQLGDTVFHYLSPFSGFSFQSNPHSEDPFLMLGNTRFHNRFYVWIVISLKSTTRKHGYSSFSKSFISSSIIEKLQKYVTASKIDFTLSPSNKTFTYSTPHINYLHPSYDWRI